MMNPNAVATVEKFYSIMKAGNFETLIEIVDSKLLEQTPAAQVIDIFRQKMNDFGMLMNYSMLKLKNVETSEGYLMAKIKFQVDYWKAGTMFEYFELICKDNSNFKIFYFEHNKNSDLVGVEE
jgi:hypothetical protein